MATGVESSTHDSIIDKRTQPLKSKSQAKKSKSTSSQDNVPKSTLDQGQHTQFLRYFGYTLLVLIVLNFIFKHFRYVLVVTILSISLVIIPIFAITLPFKENQLHQRHMIRDKFNRFRFCKTELRWQTQCKELQDDQIFVPTGDEIQSLAPLIDYVIRDFISSWFARISPDDKRFGYEVKKVMNALVCQIKDRVQGLRYNDSSTSNNGGGGLEFTSSKATTATATEEDSTMLDNDAISKILVLDLIPLVTKHFTNFVIAQDLVSGDKNGSGSSAELDLKIVKEYANNRKLHPFNTDSLKISSFNNGNELQQQHKKFARDRVTKILKILLPPSESDSKVVTVLLRELLTNVLIVPLLQKLSDADFWNQTIVSLAGSMLMDREQVRELRQIIDEQYNTEKDSKVKKSKTEDELPQMKVSASMKQPQFEKFIKQIELCDSLSVLKQLKYTVSVQISKTFKYENEPDIPMAAIPNNREKFLKYKRRLEIAKNIIDTRLTTLTNTTSTSDQSKRTSKMFTKPDLDAFINNLTLPQILNNPTSLSYFMEFMERRRRQVLLQFWITVNGIKDPLEDPYTTSEYESFTREDCDDIVDIYDRFFLKHQAILKISEDLKQDVSCFVDFMKLQDVKEVDLSTTLLDSNSTHYYTRARKAVLLLQMEVLRRMTERDLGDFKSYSLFLKLLESETFEESLVWEVQQASINDGSDISNKIENAITDILSKASSDENRPVYSQVPTEDDFISKRSLKSPVKNAKPINEKRLDQLKFGSPVKRSEIFGDDEGENKLGFLNETKPLFSKVTASKERRRSSLFNSSEKEPLSNLDRSSSETEHDYHNTAFPEYEEDADEEEEEDEDDEEEEDHEFSDEHDSIMESSFNKLLLADPEDLTQAITTLTNDIERLTHQSSLLDPLILKAELINNTTQLRLLKKSQSSYSREIEIKDLQKQQLIIQNNENSLFGQTELAINSYVTATDGDYIVYVIDVHKADKSWMIGRRFNQFYQLNEVLKKKYPSLLSGLSFPRKRMNYLILNFKQRQLIEERRGQLEIYMRRLLNMHEVCQDKEFRRFLTLDDYKPAVNNSVNDSSSGSILSNSISSLNFTNSSNEHLPASATNNATGSSSEPIDGSQMNVHQVLEMRNELDSYNKTTTEHHRHQQVKRPSNESFIKPIIDLFLVLFQPTTTNSGALSSNGTNILPSANTASSNHSNTARTSSGSTWLRGRAIVLVLQQIFGSTIENYIKEKINSTVTGDNINQLIDRLTETFWPNGSTFQRSSKGSDDTSTSQLSEHEIKQESIKRFIQHRRDSAVLLEKLLNDTCSKIVGSASVKYACIRLHSMVQNQVLNVNLIYESIDLILERIFPELKQSGGV